jgi:hypothetical protein
LNLDVKNGSLNTELKDKIIQILKRIVSNFSVYCKCKSKNRKRIQSLSHWSSGKDTKGFPPLFRKEICPGGIGEKASAFWAGCILIAAENFEKASFLFCQRKCSGSNDQSAFQ